MNIWTDPWVVGEEGRFITRSQVDEVSKVSDVIDASKMECKTELISTYFNGRDQQHILSIPLSGRAPNDALIGAYSKDVGCTL